MTDARRKPRAAAPNRLGQLAKLPVFFDLDGKRVMVTGGTAAAAWKAELWPRRSGDCRTAICLHLRLGRAPLIAERLINCGLSPDTPATIAAAVTRSGERLSHGPQSALGEDITRFDDGAPVILGIGAVCAASTAAASNSLDRIVPSIDQLQSATG